MLNLSRLHLLTQLAVLGTIGRVAEAAELTRPAVSQQLALLEQEIGSVLFERSGRGVKLTVAGEGLVAQANKLFGLVSEIESNLATAKGEVTGEVRISAFGSVATTLLPAVFKTVLKEYPNLDLRFEELEPSEGMKAVAAKQIDLALVDDSISAEALASMLYFRPICEDYYAVAMSSSHRLSQCQELSMRDLSNEKWAINKAASSFKSGLIHACHEAEFSPFIVASCRNMAATLELVRTGYVITVLPALALRTIAQNADFRVVPLRPLMKRRIFGAMAQGTFRRPAIAAILKALDSIAPYYVTLPRLGGSS